MCAAHRVQFEKHHALMRTSARSRASFDPAGFLETSVSRFL